MVKKMLPLDPDPAWAAHIAKGFWGYVDRSGGDDACWPWIGTRASHGYGDFAVRGGVHLRAHRVAYALSSGHDPGDLNVCHKCDNPPCCNPKHLFCGTARDNYYDAVLKDRARGTEALKQELVASGYSPIATFSLVELPKVLASNGVSATYQQCYHAAVNGDIPAQRSASGGRWVIPQPAIPQIVKTFSLLKEIKYGESQERENTQRQPGHHTAKGRKR